MEQKPVKRIGKYELIAKVAQGGMGALYKARHPTLDRVVLLKRLDLRTAGDSVERFKREARLMMDFKDEHIAQVYDHFKEGSHYFIVEEFVDGIPLDELIRRERYLSNESATLVLYEACKALRYAHDRQVIHRDIKPGNILISRQGDLKLVDFGIASSREEPETSITREGTMLGTPAYTAPEQVDDARKADRRSDIYSIGVVLYEMLTGRTPYPGTFTGDTIRMIHKGRYIPPQRLNPGVSRPLARIVRRCMRVRPSRRYQELSHLIRALEKRIRRRDPSSLRQAMQKVIEGKPVPELFRRRRTWLAWLLVSLLLAAALAAGGWYAWRQGYWYEYFVPDRYGALVVSAQVDSSYKSPDEVYLRPVLYRDQNGQLTRMADLDFGFHEDPLSSSAQKFVIESTRLYLPTGRYRLKLGLEEQLYWYSFTLSPRTTQRQLLATLNGQRIAVVHGKGTAQPLAISWAATSATTGKDITPGAVLSVLRGGSWIPGGAAAAEGVSSGATLSFRVESPGYLPQQFDIIVKPYQTTLSISAQLVPREGATNP